MQIKTVFQVALLVTVSGVAHGGVILSENFDAAVPNPVQAGNISNTVFAALPGDAVDVIGDQNGSFFLCPFGSGTNCVDLVGNNGTPSGITSIPSFSVVGGQAYHLTFDAAGTGGFAFTWDGSVGFGADTFLYSVSSSASNLVWDFTPVANEANVHLVFNDLTAPNGVNGIAVDNIVLSTTPVSTNPTPEPASMLMLGAGLAAIYAARRQR